MKTTNPFIIKGYATAELFCDREQELERLEENFRNGRDTTLVSARRMGKTGLILRLFDALKKDEGVETLYVDIYASRDLQDFIRLLTEAILAKFPEKSSIGKKFMQMLKGLRPTISYDAISGQPQVSILYHSDKQKEYTLKNLLEFLERQKKVILVAIDEFQQINQYPEQNTEALLRTQIQQLNNVRFIFCGSHKSLMVNIFSNAKRPFFASTQFMHLGEIRREVYARFINDTYRKFGMVVDAPALDIILDWSKLHTSYTQSLCNRIFSYRKRYIDESLVWNACYYLLKVNEPVFFQYRQLLTPAQWNFMIAVAKEDTITQITSQRFLTTYNIGTPSNARRISRSLTDKELLLEVVDKKGISYRVYDVFLSRWLQMEY